MVDSIKPVSNSLLPSAGIKKDENKSALGARQVHVSEPRKAIVPWHGAAEPTEASSGWVESPPKPTRALGLPAVKQKPQKEMRAMIQDLMSAPNYLRDRILKLAASDMKTNLAWRGRLSGTLDASGLPMIEGIETLHQSTRYAFRGTMKTLQELRALSKGAALEIAYLGIAFNLDSDDLAHVPPKIYSLELKPELSPNGRPRAGVPRGLGEKDISELRLNNMYVFSHDITEIAGIENLHDLTVELGWTFIDGMANALKAAPHLQDFRLVNATLRGNEGRFGHGPATSKDCRDLMQAVAQIPHLLSLTLVRVGGIVPTAAPPAQAPQTAPPITSRPQPRRLTLAEVEPLLTGCQKRLDLSNNEIAFTLDAIPELGANLEWLNLRGNPIPPEAVQQMRERYPGTRIDAVDAVQPGTAPQSS